MRYFKKQSNLMTGLKTGFAMPGIPKIKVGITSGLAKPAVNALTPALKKPVI